MPVAATPCESAVRVAHDGGRLTPANVHAKMEGVPVAATPREAIPRLDRDDGRLTPVKEPTTMTPQAADLGRMSEQRGLGDVMMG